MSSKYKGIAVMLSIVAVSVGGIGYYAWKLYRPAGETSSARSSQKSSTDGYVGSLSPTSSNSISLNQSANKSSSDSSSLKVTNGSPDDASLGTLQQLQTSGPTVADSSSQTIPGPDTFGQFESYANKDEVYYVDYVTGSGPSPTQDKRLAVIYKGWLTNGTLFDQSRTNDKNQLEPFIFTLGAGQVIPGWDIGIADMKVGGTRRLVIPPSLAYGENGASGVIPPNAVLIFDVQLIEVE